MQRLIAADLLPLEQYARERAQIRQQMMAHRRARQLSLGPHCSLSFEDRDTVRYQVQEMLRAERIFEPTGIAEELAAYNPLIPDGRNLKATMMIEYDDAALRARRLQEMRGIERRCWMQVAGSDRVYAVADEDLDRETVDKTSAVHFLRFEFTVGMVAALKAGANLAAGVDHPAYTEALVPLPAPLQRALLADLD